MALTVYTSKDYVWREVVNPLRGLTLEWIVSLIEQGEHTPATADSHSCATIALTTAGAKIFPASRWTQIVTNTPHPRRNRTLSGGSNAGYELLDRMGWRSPYACVLRRHFSFCAHPSCSRK